MESRVFLAWTFSNFLAYRGLNWRWINRFFVSKHSKNVPRIPRLLTLNLHSIHRRISPFSKIVGKLPGIAIWRAFGVQISSGSESDSIRSDLIRRSDAPFSAIPISVSEIPNCVVTISRYPKIFSVNLIPHQPVFALFWTVGFVNIVSQSYNDFSATT